MPAALISLHTALGQNIFAVKASTKFPFTLFSSTQVVGGASIGNTDPFLMIAKVDEQLGSCSVPLELAPVP